MRGAHRAVRAGVDVGAGVDEHQGNFRVGLLYPAATATYRRGNERHSSTILTSARGVEETLDDLPLIDDHRVV